MIRRCALMMLACLFSLSAAGNLASELFDQANRLYEKGDFDSSETLYRRVLDMGVHDAKVYYNLGNAQFRKKEVGPAILNYEKALLLRPSDRDIRANLDFARAQTQDKIVPRETGFFEKILLTLHNLLPARIQAAVILLLLFAASGCFTLFLLAGARVRAMALPAMAVAFVLAAPVALSLGLKVHAEKNVREAVLLASSSNALSEPGSGQVLFAIHEGAKFRLHRKVAGWYFATLENGLSGWVRENELGLIEIGE